MFEKIKKHLTVLSASVVMTVWLAIAAAMTNLVGIHLNDFTGTLWYIVNLTISIYVADGVWVAIQKVKDRIEGRIKNRR